MSNFCEKCHEFKGHFREEALCSNCEWQEMRNDMEQKKRKRVIQDALDRQKRFKLFLIEHRDSTKDFLIKELFDANETIYFYELNNSSQECPDYSDDFYNKGFEDGVQSAPDPEESFEEKRVEEERVNEIIRDIEADKRGSTYDDYGED